MSDVIGFLESLGARPAGSPQDYAREVAGLAVGPEARDALLRRDPAALNALLGGRAAMWCAVLSPDESPDPSPDDSPAESPDDAPLEDPVRIDPVPDADGD